MNIEDSGSKIRVNHGILALQDGDPFLLDTGRRSITMATMG